MIILSVFARQVPCHGTDFPIYFCNKKMWASEIPVLNTSSSIIPRAGREAECLHFLNQLRSVLRFLSSHHTHCNKTSIKVVLSCWSLTCSMLLIPILNCEWTPYVNVSEMVKEVERRAVMVIRGGWVEFFIGLMLSKLGDIRLKVKGTLLVEGKWWSDPNAESH